MRALVKLLAIGNEDEFPWTFADTAPYDVIVVDAASPAVGSAQLQSLSRATFLLGADTAQTSSTVHVLARPLRAEQLSHRLNDIQTRLGTVSLAAPSSPSLTVAAELKQLDLRYKLRRWPPTPALRGDAARVRMATLLSRRAMTISELASVSQQSQERCQVFVQLLQSMTLIDVVSLAPDGAVAAGTPNVSVLASAAVPAPSISIQLAPKTPAPWALVRSIRKSLGI